MNTLRSIQQDCLPRLSHSFCFSYSQQEEIFSTPLKLLSTVRSNLEDVPKIYRLGKTKTEYKRKKITPNSANYIDNLAPGQQLEKQRENSYVPEKKQ